MSFFLGIFSLERFKYALAAGFLPCGNALLGIWLYSFTRWFAFCFGILQKPNTKAMPFFPHFSPAGASFFRGISLLPLIILRWVLLVSSAGLPIRKALSPWDWCLVSAVNACSFDTNTPLFCGCSFLQIDMKLYLAERRLSFSKHILPYNNVPGSSNFTGINTIGTHSKHHHFM